MKNIETDCDGSLRKKNAIEGLCKCIEKFASHQGISQEAALFRLVSIGLRELEKQPDPKECKLFDELSGRQRAVLNALRGGSSVKEVADQLAISEVTVRTHIQRIRERLGCSDILRLRIPEH